MCARATLPLDGSATLPSLQPRHDNKVTRTHSCCPAAICSSNIWMGHFCPTCTLHPLIHAGDASVILVSCPISSRPKTDENRPHAALRILTRCAHRSAEQGPLWGCDRVGVHKNAIVPMRLHPASGSHPHKWGPCSAVC